MTEQEYYVLAGRRFRTLRESKDMSQYDLAQKTGYNQALISKFENHGKKISTFRMDQLLKAIGCTMSDLFPESGASPKKKTLSTSVYPCQPVMA